MYMTLYCDSTDLFTEEEITSENLCDLCFPERIVRDWYEQHKTDFDYDTAEWLQIPLDECTFELWVNEAYTAESTDGVYADETDKTGRAVLELNISMGEEE